MSREPDVSSVGVVTGEDYDCAMDVMLARRGTGPTARQTFIDALNARLAARTTASPPSDPDALDARTVAIRECAQVVEKLEQDELWEARQWGGPTMVRRLGAAEFAAAIRALIPSDTAKGGAGK